MRVTLPIALTILLAAAPAAAGQHEVVVDSGGKRRTAVVHVPARATRGKRPLVLFLHGGGGSARQAMDAYRMNEVADRSGFIVAYPNGSGPLRREILLTWNAGNCCDYALEKRVDDVAFLRALVDEIGRRFAVDRDRVYATGMSNGGMMSYRLACEAADIFAAVAPVAGALNVSCKPSRAVAVLAIHGTADEHVGYDGGTGTKTRHGRVDRSVSSAIDFWRNANGCTKEAPTTASSIVRREGWTGCSGGADVSLVTVIGGGHAWPGGEPASRRSADTPSPAIQASEEIWRFFAAHPKR